MFDEIVGMVRRSRASHWLMVASSLAGVACADVGERATPEPGANALELGTMRAALQAPLEMTAGIRRVVPSVPAEAVISESASLDELLDRAPRPPLLRVGPDHLPPADERLLPSGASRPAPDQPAPTRIPPEEQVVLQQLPSPAPAASFRAAFDTGWIPPDTNGAVGPNHLVVAHNGLVAFQTRAGVTLESTTLIDFFSPVDTSGDVFDPLIRYDQLDGRWLLVAMAARNSPQSAVLLAVSQSTDPTAGWLFFSFDADPSDFGWADFPKLGFNRNWVVAQANLLGGNGDLVLACDKAALYAGTGSCRRFQDFELSFTNPAVTYDPELQTEYLGRVLNSFEGTLAIHTITGPVGQEVLTLNAATVTLPASWQQFAPFQDFAPQLGRDEGIETDFLAALATLVVRNGSLWGTQTAYLPAEFPATRSSILWWQADTSGALEQFGSVDDPTNQRFYAFPSLGVNRNEDVLIGYASFSESQYASGSYSFRAGTDAPGTLREEVILKAGEAPYFKDFGSGRNRWGDYSHTTVDPVNDLDLWTIQEFADTPPDTWGTWWGKIVPPGSGDDDVTTTLTITNDWGTGYCATLDVTNNTEETATNFQVSLDLNGTTIYTSWNGIFSGRTGAVTVTPAFDWNRILSPGETDSSIGFCANRQTPGSNVATVVSTTATFTSPDATVVTTLRVQNDWGAGYCAVLSVQNTSTQTVAGFSITLNLNGTSIYDDWNGNFSGSTGTVTVRPAVPSSAILDPGEVDSSIGFCANRGATGTQVATVIGTTPG